MITSNDFRFILIDQVKNNNSSIIRPPMLNFHCTYLKNWRVYITSICQLNHLSRSVINNTLDLGSSTLSFGQTFLTSEMWLIKKSASYSFYLLSKLYSYCPIFFIKLILQDNHVLILYFSNHFIQN